jgi:hypothetical protein
VTFLSICEWLENTQVALLVRESAYGFPIVVAVHILGLSVSVGLVIWFDLRLLGVSMPRCRLSDVWRGLMPWALTGFVVMFVSGGLLFAAFATSAYGNLAFRIKSAAIILAGLNALVYHLVTERGIAEWDVGVRPPRSAQMAGLLSIVLWTTVILSGRMMSYTMF